MNITEKIIAAHGGRKRVVPGEIVEVDVDLCMANDVTIPLNIEIFRDKFSFSKVWDREKVIFVNDHRVPADNLNTAVGHKITREFAREQGIRLHENDGVCHQVMLESHIRPGQLIVAADSHTCSYGCIGSFGAGMGSTDVASVMGTGKTWLKVPETINIQITGNLAPGVSAKDVILFILKKITASGASYKTLEFSGPLVDTFNQSERFTLCNMVIEAGGKSAMIRPDQRILARYDLSSFAPDLFSETDPKYYSEIIDIDVTDLKPQVSCPHMVDHVFDAEQIKGKKITQAFLGACTNGRIEDLRVAAGILKGKCIHSDVRFLVTPASVKTYLQALSEGLIEIFLKAGVTLNHPGCSTCWGACQGVLAPGERMISSANRNFKGRAGSPDSEIYLGSPATVTASAITGEITDPSDVRVAE